MTNRSHRIFLFIVLAGSALAPFHPALATPTSAPKPVSAPKPAPPCGMPGGLPGPIATRFEQLGGVERFGCAVNVTGPVYIFHSGRIEAVPVYGPSATYAAIVDASRIVHLYFSGSQAQNPVDRWLVRLTYDGSLINQVTYKAGDGDVGGTYASNILVHPGNRHGTFEIAMEGCFTGIAGSDCLGWSYATFMMDL